MGSGSGWLAYALLCLIMWGLWGLVLKVASKGSSWLEVYFLSAIASFAVAVTVFVFGGPHLKVGRSALLALLAGVFGGGGYVLFMKALSTGKASVVVPLTALYPALTAVLALVVLGEKISTTQALGIVLAVLAAVLLSL